MIKSFKRQVVYEWKAGIRSRVKMYLLVLLIFLLLGISIWISADAEMVKTLTVSDYLTKIFLGITEMKTADRTTSFYLPKEWAIVQVVYLLFISTYPKKDETERGYQVLLRNQNKKIWWFGKCQWLVMTTFFYYALLYFVLLFISTATGEGFVFDVAIRNIWGLQKLKMQTGEGWLALYIMPWLSMMAIGFGEMLLSFLLNPAAAVGISLCYLISSIYVAAPWLLGNYSMIVRNSQVMESGGVSCFYGIIESVGVIGVILLAGSIYMRKRETGN